MYCPFCGNEIYDHATICTYCGSMINLPVEMTEAEIRRLRNQYKERFGDKARVDFAVKQIEAQAEYIPALYGARAFAFLLDWGVIIALAVVISNNLRASKEFTLLLTPLLAFLYFVFFTSAFGRTIGKFIVGIKVIEEKTGKKPSVTMAFGRTISMIISTVFLFAGFFAPYFDAKGRCWHDILSGTVVIYKR